MRWATSLFIRVQSGTSTVGHVWHRRQ